MYYDRTDGGARRASLVNARSVGWALAVHLALVLFFWAAGKAFMRAPETIIPIDMTVVPPWAEQTDDPEPDPNPPPPDEPKAAPKPPPEPEPVKEEPKIEAVEQVKEKKPEKPKEPEKPKKVDLREKAKLVKTPPKPAEPTDLRKKATLVKPPPTKVYGKGTAADKPLSPEEFQRLMNQGYRVGARNQIANSEEQRCVSLIRQAILREWDKESFSWNADLQKLNVTLRLGPGGAVRGFQFHNSSGDPAVDRTAQNALRRLRSIPGLSASFLEQFPQLTIVMEPTGR